MRPTANRLSDGAQNGGDLRNRVLYVLAVALLSAYPLSLMLRANLGVVPIGARAIASILAVDLAIAVALFLLLRLVTADFAGRAAWLSVFFLVFGTYNVALQTASALGWYLRPERAIVPVAYTLLSAAVATMAVRPWRQRRRDPIPLLIVGVVLVGANALAGASRAGFIGSVPTSQATDWHSAAESLIGASLSTAQTAEPPRRDIYYIVLDGFGSFDTLKRLYDIDLDNFGKFLSSKGFTVIDRASTNYAQTFLALAATLNLGYLDAVANGVGRDSSDRSPLGYLIDHNALMTLAKRAGYRVVGVGSDYMATERLVAADVCLCDQFGSGSTEQAIFASTPFASLALGSRAFGAHRRKVLDALDHLERPRDTAQRSFVFAHIISPHPPFVFEADGGSPPDLGLFMFNDGNHYSGSRDDYRRGYRNQTEFLTHRLETLVESILSRPGPPPAIVLHGDHGPGMNLNWNDAGRTDIEERMRIFAAYYLPDATTQPYPTMTPVNGSRLLSNQYLGTNLPLLKDESYFSTWNRPYGFISIPRSDDHAP